MIYYIYKVRRKQTFIRSSRSALPHRYLRYISWISWNGSHRPQPSMSWVFHPRAAAARALFSRQCLCPKAAVAALLLLLPPGGQSKYSSDLFSRKRKQPLSPFPTHLSRVAPSALLCPLPLSRAATCGRSIVCRPRRFRGPPINKKCGPAALRREPAHHVCQTCSKKRRLPAQESTRRHAWLTRSCFGRKNLFIDGPHSLLPFFLSPFLQRKRKKKTEVNSAGSNTSLGLTSFVLTMYAIGPAPSSATKYVAIATRFIRDCVEDLAVLAASMERISRCSWHIKDQCLGVIKASRVSLYLCVSFSSQNFSPIKI